MAIVGAAGHTGRFVVAELRRRGLHPIAIVRPGTQTPRDWSSAVEVREVDLASSAPLQRSLAGARVVINCAGPFLDSAAPVAAAAIAVGAHYLDIAAEQASAAETLERFKAPARDARVLVLPAMSFYGGLADLLATSAAGDWREVDEVEVAIALDSWRPTYGTRRTGARNTVPRVIVEDGRIVTAPQPAAERTWTFPQPFGAQEMVVTPLTEVILISEHIRTRRLRTWLNKTPLADLQNADTPPPEAVDERGRSAQRFQVEVIVRKGREARRARASGQDIYAITAPLVCEAAERLLVQPPAQGGALAPGAVFDARDFLSALAPELVFEHGLEAAEAP